MNIKNELAISIAQADSLKRMAKMPGWKIPEKFLKESIEKYNRELKDKNNKDLSDIQACRKILDFINDFKDIFRFSEISADEDEKELKELNKVK